MKIVNRAEFLAMPVGTVYMMYRPMTTTSELEVKHSNCNADDWFAMHATGIITVENDSSCDLADKCDAMEKDSGLSLPYGIGIMRDGCFDAGQQFLIYEPDDVRAMVALLTNAIAGKVD